jgi:outer membrane biosynthesis protein TonB
MNFDQSDWIMAILLVVLGVSVLVAIAVIAKTFANEARERKARAARLAAEEENSAPQNPPQVPAKPKPEAKPKPKAKAKPAKEPAHKDDVHEDADLVAAAEVYLTYELKEQAISSLEKHLLTHPTDKRALYLIKKAEATAKKNDTSIVEYE